MIVTMTWDWIEFQSLSVYYIHRYITYNPALQYILVSSLFPFPSIPSSHHLFLAVQT
jgi:hypothetical protein